MNRYTGLICTGILTLLAASNVLATDRFWQVGATGSLVGANYTDNAGTAPLAAPVTGDIVNVGANGSATLDGTITASASFGKLRVGHVVANPTNALNNTGTVTINNGATLQLTAGASGVDMAALWVAHGNGPNGTLNIDNATVVSNQLAVIGYGNNVNKSGTVNITNGGNLTVSRGNLVLGEKLTGSGATSGVQGYVIMSGSTSILNVSGNNADFTIGIRSAKASYTQNGGTATINDQIVVGQRNSDTSSFNVSAGTLSAGGALNLSTGTAADGNSDNIAANITGTAQVTLGASELFTANALSPNGLTNISLLAGSFDAKNTTVVIKDDSTLTTSGVVSIGVDNALNSSLTVKNNAKLNTGANITVGSNSADGASFTISDLAEVKLPASLTSAGNVFIGRGTSKNTTFTMNGGKLTVGNQFLMGTAASGALNIVGNHSAGTLTTASNFTLADTFGPSTYNLSGTGVVSAGGQVIVGRQSATGTMIQTGGTLTSALGITIGNAFSTNTSLWGTGVYNVSGGVINANQTTGTALSIAPQGNAGTFRVIGDGADINVNGNMTVNSAAGTIGTLAYQLETGESLSVIDVTGTATFASGAILDFDPSAVATPQSSYDLLIAGAIVDNNIAFNVLGWNYRIVDAPLAGDHNGDRFVDAADFVHWRANDGTDQGYVDFRENFSVAGRKLLQVYQDPPGSSALQDLESAAVPEPATLLLLLCGAFGLMLVRRR